ncbi:SAM-dependent methyltransferase [Actinomadura sp. NBRC 104412]|uniref:DNA adenine methylase n=1 Tax=Actinomadura sp. NBRC 104412 TaxID=3032203 RepID=UPI0024A51B59|nr:DNA adenine methylase [Actinomadura sp. NBRC 104412]GLZ09608.1 SAM-dependent methyltransferase [Actinomadura sp. NBRC 104412]
MKPPLAYYGAKTSIGPRIAAMLGPHEHYVEPFAGSLAVLLAKRPSRMETVNDLDEHLMTFWQVLRDRPADLIRVCALTPHSRAEHLAAYQPVPADHPDQPLEAARRVWVRLSQGRTGTLRQTGWRFFIDPAGSSTSMPGYLTGYVNRMAAVAQRLSQVSLECRPALDVITAYGAEPDVLLYVDPPYLGSTRSRNYRYEMGSASDHRDLAAALNSCRATVVLSGYESPLYQDLYADWHRHRIPSGTSQGGHWSSRTEVLWSNRRFPVPDSLFDTEGAA